MKILAAITVSLLATAALACPNLSGNYQCHIEMERGIFVQGTISIQQTENEYTFSINIGGDKLTVIQKADGVKRLDEVNSDSEINIFTTNTCTPTQLMSSDRQVIKANTQDILPTSTLSLTSLKDGHLVTTNTETLHFRDGSTEVETSQATCKRL